MSEKWEASWQSEKTDWETPPTLFKALDAEFHFTLDAAAQEHNKKVANYYSPQMNGLIRPWTGVVWCNPPYGKEIGQWVKKGRDSALAGATVVMLVYARTDTRWFHDYVYGQAEIRFLRGRVKFVGAESSAPAPSMVIVWRPEVDKSAETVIE